MADANNEFSTVLGPDATFKGQLEFEKGVRLLGHFEGEIHSGGQLVVADGAALTGDVNAEKVRVDGQVKGNIQAGQKVELSASARMEGDLQTTRLEVAEGAVLVGRCMVGVNGAPKPPADSKVASPSAAVSAGKPKGNTPVPARK